MLFRRIVRSIGIWLTLSVSGFIAHGVAQTISPNQLAGLTRTVASKGITDVIAIRFLRREDTAVEDVVVVGEGGGHGWRIIVFESRDEGKPLPIRWDSGYLPDYFGPASADDVTVEQLPDKEQVLVFQACAPHLCPVEAFGIAVYSPWTGKGYFAYSDRTGVTYSHGEPERYHEELVKLVAETKHRWQF